MATWDENYHFRGFLYIHKPAVVFKARIDAPDGYIFPTRELVFDGVTVGAYTDVEPGMTVYIGSTDGAYDLGRQRVRSSHPTNLQIGWSSLGTHDGEMKLPDNAYLTVVDLRQVWSRIPFIEIASGESFKDRDINFVAADAQPPVANGGVGYAQFVDDVTGVITVEFDSTNSYPVNPLSVLGSVLWDVKDGTITVGVDTDQIITATFPPGFRYVSLTVTDDGARSHTCYIPVFAAEPTGDNAPIYDFEVTNHQLTVEGAKISFLVRQNIPTSTYPDGSLVIYWEQEWYNNVEVSINGYAGREHVKFVGFIHGEPTQVEAGELVTLAQVTLDCLDVAGKLATLPGFSQVVRRAASPASWLEMAGANTDRYLHYLLHWHTTALELTDFYLSGSSDLYQFISFTSDGANFYAQVDGRAQATGTGYRLSSDSQGIMRVQIDPMMQESGDRTSTSQADFTESHLTRYGYSKQRPPRVHWTRTSALVTSGSELTLQNVVHSIAPGAAPGQGESSEVLGNRLVISQEQSNIFTGNAYERSNAPESMFDIEVANGGVQIEPAFMTWIRLTTTSRYAAQRGLIFTNERFLPANVSIARNSANGSKRVSFTAEREVIGNPAATYVPPIANLPGYTEPSVYFGEVLDIADTGFAGVTNFGMFATDGNLYRTFGFTAPAWTQVSLGVTGTPTAFTVDAYSPLYLTGTGDVNGWLATVDVDGVRIYSIEDIFNVTAPTVTLLFTSTSIPYDFANIASERVTQDFVIASWFDETLGTFVAYSTDGASFTEVNVTAFVQTNLTSPAYTPALYVYGGGIAYVGAFSATGADDAALGKFYATADDGATWALSHGTLLTSLGYSLHVPFAASGTQWYTKRQTTGNLAICIYYDGTTENDRSPIKATKTVAPTIRNKSLATNPTDASQVLLCGADELGALSVHRSINGGIGWSEIVHSLGNLRGCDVDSNGNGYVWGDDGAVGYIPFGGGAEDRSANITDDFGVIGDILGVVGG